MARTKQPVKPLNQTPAQVRRNAEAEKTRKAASKAALRAATRDVPETDPKPRKAAPTKPEPSPAEVEVKRQAEARATLVAQRTDFDALCEADQLPATTSFVDYLRDQGFDQDGFPLRQVSKTPYDGPMIALKAARVTYVKAANGILCNGSPLALLCGQYKRDVVVKALIAALKLPSNPYLHLNPGQQSMNLRNKARHAIGEGTLSLGEIEAELKAEAAIANAK